MLSYSRTCLAKRVMFCVTGPACPHRRPRGSQKTSCHRQRPVAGNPLGPPAAAHPLPPLVPSSHPLVSSFSGTLAPCSLSRLSWLQCPLWKAPGTHSPAVPPIMLMIPFPPSSGWGSMELTSPSPTSWPVGETEQGDQRWNLSSRAEKLVNCATGTSVRVAFLVIPGPALSWVNGCLQSPGCPVFEFYSVLTMLPRYDRHGCVCVCMCEWRVCAHVHA